MGMAPFGISLSESLASTISAPTTLMINGIAVILGASVLAYQLPSLRKEMRPICIRLGIVSEGSAEERKEHIQTKTH